MSLKIQVENIVDILLADGWHNVMPETLDLDAYEFFDGNIAVHKGGQGGICSTGATWQEEDGELWLTAPLTSILAIREKI